MAEIASTTNEALLLDYMLKDAKNDDERLLYLGSALESLRGTFFRQAMFAEFERDVHARVDKGEPLTGAQLTQIYGEILRRYHGDAGGREDRRPLHDRVGVHPALLQRRSTSSSTRPRSPRARSSPRTILAGKPGARERYLKLLSAGGSDYPYELVKAAGVDLATPAPYDAIAARMNRIMDEIEAILAKRK